MKGRGGGGFSPPTKPRSPLLFFVVGLRGPLPGRGSLHCLLVSQAYAPRSSLLPFRLSANFAGGSCQKQAFPHAPSKVVFVHSTHSTRALAAACVVVAPLGHRRKAHRRRRQKEANPSVRGTPTSNLHGAHAQHDTLHATRHGHSIHDTRYTRTKLSTCRAECRCCLGRRQACGTSTDM